MATEDFSDILPRGHHAALGMVPPAQPVQDKFANEGYCARCGEYVPDRANCDCPKEDD